MNDPTRRALRTLVQGLPSAALVGCWQVFTVGTSLHMTDPETVAILPLLVALASFLQNALEASGSTVTTVVAK